MTTRLPAFEVLVDMARNDPEGLETLRRSLTNAVIATASSEISRRRLEGLQFRVDLERRRAQTPLTLACIAVIVSIWIEKGLGMIVTGFVPSPLGKVTSYVPTIPELLITLGILIITLTIALPGFREFFDRERLISATEQVYGVLQKARMESMAEKREVAE